MTDLRARSWCFTINNFSPEEQTAVKEFIENKCSAGIAETEVGEQGTPHIQGYLRIDNVIRLSTLRRFFPRAHFEIAKGTLQQNWDYCSKDNNVFVEKGHSRDIISAGKTSFYQMIEDMKAMTPDEFALVYPKMWFMHREKVLAMMIDNAKKNVSVFGGNLPDKNIWIWGEPGVGKSRWAQNQAPPENTFKKNFNKWWDGYSLLTTKLVIIEDYPSTPAGNTLAQHMKIWGDRYPFVAECKCSHLSVEPRRFFLIITSNYSISECFSNIQDVNAIKRRFKEIHCTSGDMYSQCMISLDLNSLNDDHAATVVTP